MQAKNFVLSGGAATITAPNGGTVFRIIGTAGFNFTYADFFAGGLQVGNAAAAVAFGSNFIFDVLAPAGSAFVPGQILGYVSGGGVQTVSCVPVINANKPVVFKTGGSTNGSQTTFNLVGGGTITITDNGSGTVTIDDVATDPTQIIQVAATDQAVGIKQGTVIITKGSAIALALAAPTAGAQPTGDDGRVLRFVPTTNFSHVINTDPNKLNGNKQHLTLVPPSSGLVVAYNGVWYVITNNAGNLT